MKEYIERDFAYNAWANQRICDSIKGLPEASPERERALKLLAHLLAASALWRSRLVHENANVGDIWPTNTLDECSAIAALDAKAWSNYLASLPKEGYSNSIRYRNLKGDSFENSLHEILNHVVNHGTHHRGQISLLVRDGGATPAVTDFIAFVREQTHGS